MRKEKIIIEILERGDVVLTPGGLAQVVESEELSHYIQAGSYYKTIKVRWLESTGEHPDIGSITNIEKESCIYNWESKEKDLEKVKKHIK